MIRQKITVINKLGLHARAATKLASTAGRYKCSVNTGIQEPLVDAKSIMLLAASKDTNLIFEFKGPEEQLACDAISSLFADYFGEGE
jgi:phosphocarrier protein HPr